eukprot:CAMPEP_0171147810 /NCGR_PEP_ID=MMETSP0766_2-20121228/148253_1 /TAXON_ID=439317 /ORGANISM="Gambierdiscus australes, Strain CAWD 149" /LENGTH=295 /DNA_ID=CAMNT_0011611719 /DNA_START=744 /DNA_END=1628 /DNA_ORIENTATION=+
MSQSQFVDYSLTDEDLPKSVTLNGVRHQHGLPGHPTDNASPPSMLTRTFSGSTSLCCTPAFSSCSSMTGDAARRTNTKGASSVKTSFSTPVSREREQLHNLKHVAISVCGLFPHGRRLGLIYLRTDPLSQRVEQCHATLANDCECICGAKALVLNKSLRLGAGASTSVKTRDQTWSQFSTNSKKSISPLKSASTARSSFAIQENAQICVQLRSLRPGECMKDFKEHRDRLFTSRDIRSVPQQQKELVKLKPSIATCVKGTEALIEPPILAMLTPKDHPRFYSWRAAHKPTCKCER